MKNLIPLKQKRSYWNAIVNNKGLVDRIPLQAIRLTVMGRFNIYAQHSTPITLEAITISPFQPPSTNIKLLKRCYSKSASLSNLKKRIKKRQNVLLRAECQYCNIGEPNTFDHYLPKADFPEFSALSINLIPCCSKCNTNKDQHWLLPNGNRKIINYYYDTLPTVNYLDCIIVYKNNIPKAEFTLNTAIIPINMRATI